MTATRESVVRMANQIVRNFSIHGDPIAIAETAEHIRLFWDPRMRKQAYHLLAEPDCGLSGQARAALLMLASEAGHRAA